MMLYEEIFEKLNSNGVDYVVVGGVALVLHGAVRLTADLDLMVHLEDVNLGKFIEVMKELGYKPKIPARAEELISADNRARWITEKNMKVFSFFHPERAVNLIDVSVEEPLDYTTIRSKAVEIISGRPQDIADITALKEIMKRGGK